MQVFAQNLLCKTVMLDYFLVKISARLGRALKIMRKIHVNEPESRLIRTPFVIVHRRPIQISPHVCARFDCRMHRGKIFGNPHDAEIIIITTAPVFGDINRFVV